MNKIAIFGIGISGKSVINYLIKNNHQVIAIDDNKIALKNLEEKYQNNKNINFCYNQEKLNFKEIEFLIISPGVPLKYPKPHNIVNLANQNNCKIIGDTELFYLLNKEKKFIGITGTNGKSTTTSLTGHIFEENKVSSQIGGNIGTPCFDLANKDNYIFEMSSYQLDLSHKTHFNIAALLNITPDHIDRHKNLKGYIEAKTRIFLNQNKQDFALINIDDKNCYKVYEDLINNDNFKAKIIKISNKSSKNSDICLINDQIINNISKKAINLDFLYDLNNLKGSHNKQNILFAYAISFLNKITDDNIIKALKSFQGLKHRLQFIKKIDNISFINDSKATNITSTISALESYNDVFWIAGGKSKNEDLNQLKPYLKNIKKAFLIGEDQEIFANFLNKNKIENYICDNLDNSFKKALDFTKKESNNINILLSPACASFDQWENFEERGDYFIQLVNKLKNDQ